MCVCLILRWVPVGNYFVGEISHRIIRDYGERAMYAMILNVDPFQRVRRAR